MENARTFTNRLAELLAREHAALGEFLVSLAQFDDARLWLQLGYPSLFDFLHRELGLSKASASFRKKAAELIQRFPETLDPIRDGRLCLSSVFELAKVLTPENRHEVLPRFFQLSKREAKLVAAALRPDDAPPQRCIITPVRSSVIPSTTLAVPMTTPTAPASSEDPASSLTVVCPAKLTDAKATFEPGLAGVRAPPPPPMAEPLTAELSRLHVTVSRRFLQKLESARDALSHSHPNAGMEEILEAGLDLVLERHAKRKGLVKKPRPEPRPSSDPEYVPAHVRRAVWERDGGRCQWPLASGGVCGSMYQVELDHRVAKARGGPPTVENMRCLCRPHQDVAAREVLGDAWMDQFTRNPRAGSASDASSGVTCDAAPPAAPGSR